MKRRFFAVFAVLLVLMLATCDLIEPGAGDNFPRFTDDGRPMVRLTIDLGKKGVSRTMNDTQAQGIVNDPDGDAYFEVAFKDPKPGSTKIYRADWAAGETGLIAVPMGVYTNANQAILFAGERKETAPNTYEYTLLAIGIISAIDNIPLGSLTSLGPAGAVDGVAEIFAETVSVTFALNALKSSVNKTSSSFEILGPTSDNEDNDDFSTSNKGIDSFHGGFMFTIPGFGYASTIDDSSTATDGPSMDTDESIVGLYTIGYGVSANNGSIYDGVYVAGNNWVHAVNYPGLSLSPLVLVTRFPQLGDSIPRDGGFYFNIDVENLTEDQNGLHEVYMEVPVYAISSDNSPIPWYIRGGLDNKVLDEGLAASTGGAFLLNVGGLVGLEIKKTGP